MKNTHKRKKGIILRILILLFLLTVLVGLSLTLYRTYQDPSFLRRNMQTAPDSTGTGTDGDNLRGSTGETEPEDPGPSPEEVFAEFQDLPPEPFEYPITLMAVGDNLMHMGVVYTGRRDDGSYNYECLYRDISDFIELSDIRIINQETIMAGNQLGFSGFPYFNSPVEVADGIAAAGFNVVLQASNHSADQGAEGIDYCYSVWQKHPEVLMVGIHSGEEHTPDTAPAVSQGAAQPAAQGATQPADREIPLLKIDGVTFAVLNYTYAPNSGYMPPALQTRLEVLCNYNEKGYMDFTTINPKVLEDIKRADALADVVIVCPHWGTEYSTTPSGYQKKWAKQMTEAGADLIIGAHPHVIEPVEWVQGENGNEALCFYSLGNYVSTQKDPISMLEAMAWVTFLVKEEGDIRTVTISHTDSGAIPLVCQYSSSPVRIKGVYPLQSYTEELAAAHGIRSYGYGVLNLEELQNWSKEILGEFEMKIPY